LPSGDILSRIKSCFRIREKPLQFRRFKDGMGNFEMDVPDGWKCDEDIAVVDGKYTISFQSKDGLSQFTVSIDAKIPGKFSFQKYAKSELESPASGIYTPVSKSVFHKMPAFVRDYHYQSGGRHFFGGGVMFFTGAVVFSLNWSAPESLKERAGCAFISMKKSFLPRAGFIMRKAMPPGLAGRDEA
jgi:hypothetical protein